MKNKTELNHEWSYLSLILVFLSVSIQSFAYDFLVDNIYYKITNSATHEVAVTLKSYIPGGRYEDATIISDYVGDVVIPSSIIYNGTTYSVTGIDNYAFDDSDVTSVSIPNTVKSIGYSAFAYCASLTEIIIPNSVTCIGNNAFSSCSGLTSVTIPNSVTSISDYAFSACTSLTSINIPNSVTSFGFSIFTGSGIIDPIICGASFLYCPPTYEGEYHIPMGVKEVIGGAFSGCTKITKIIIPHGVTRINNSTFTGCTSLENISLPSTLEYVGPYAFSSCMSLKECIIPPTVSGVGKYAFSMCTSLESIVLPASMNPAVDDGTFNFCQSLKTVVFPVGVTYIMSGAFAHTPKIEVYNFASGLQDQNDGPTFLDPSCIHVPTGWQNSGWQYNPISGTLAYDIESISSISITQTNLDLTEGEAVTLSYTILPSTASVKTLHWSSNNTDVAIVDNDGKVTAINKGSATITATSLDGSNLSTICLVTVNEVDPASENYLSIKNTEVCTGKQIVLPVNMNNTENVTALQFDLTLPAGVSIAKNGQGKYIVEKTERCADHTLNVNKQGEVNVYKVLLYIVPVERITGNEGAVLNVTLETSESMTEGEYDVLISNINLTTPDETKITPANVTCKLTVKNSIPGDANGDGDIDVTDIVSIANYILGKTSGTIDLAGADANGDGDIDVTDIVTVANIILHGSGQNNAKMRGGKDEENMLDPQ